MIRTFLFACLAVLPASAMAVAGSNSPSDDDLPAALVKDIHAIFGEHHARAVHAKGIVFEGIFKPSAEAQGLSVAPVFKAETPVTVRFSNTTGLPDIPDADPNASPHGLAVKFALPDSSTLDVVTHSFNGFPAATAREFHDFLSAVAQSGPKAAKPNPLNKFLETHPAAKAFVTEQKPPPESFATTAYFGVNAFTFIDAKGTRTLVRYRMVPRAGETYLDASASAAKGPNYLFEEIAARIGKEPVMFDWQAQIAEADDKADDPSTAWPEARKRITLGTITVNQAAKDQAEADKSLLFLPASLPDGIEVADPMLDVRNNAYPISFGERQ